MLLQEPGVCIQLRVAKSFYEGTSIVYLAVKEWHFVTGVTFQTEFRNIEITKYEGGFTKIICENVVFDVATFRKCQQRFYERSN